MDSNSYTVNGSISIQLISPTNMSMENLFRQADMDPTKKYIPQMEAADISQ